MAVPVVPEFEVNVGKSKESQDFGFHFSAKLARTLAETLYDYKIEAVVREYSTNITDSHTDAGFPEKKGFVQVPTKINPNIKFQDFGVGMSKGTILKTYTVFGKSTKEHDNSTNGSLGYGSKSAFSISEQFTVTSVKDGIKTVVVCYKDRTGLPKADVKSETSTGSQNGTTVEIPVKLSQVNEWQEACARVLGAFRVPHEVNTFGDYQNEYDEIKSLCEQVRSEGSLFVNNPSYELTNHRSKTMVLMGDVLYHLPNFKSLIAKTSIKSLVETFVSSGVYVAHFNIGDLDHAPSREAISYDPQTLLKVRRRVNSDIKKEYRKFSKELGSVDKSVSFYKFYKQYSNTPVWEMIEGLTLPFTQGNTLRKLDPRNRHNWGFKKVSFIHNNEVYGKIRGLVPSEYSTTVFSHCVETFNQCRLLLISNPVIVYSELEKGIYKMKETLTTIHEKFDRHVLYVDSKQKAENLHNWFGCGEVICGDNFSPEKTKRLKGTGNTRGSYGIKEDYETVGTYVEVYEDGSYSKQSGKVDLTEDGVYWAEQDYLIVKGIVPKMENNFSASCKNLSKMLKIVSGKKVIIKNKNNKGKIERSGVPSLRKALADVVKKHKPMLIKHLVWQENPITSEFDQKERILLENNYLAKRLEKRYIVGNKVPETVEKIKSLSSFNLYKTKRYQQQLGNKEKCINKLRDNVRATISKLPLADKFNTYNSNDIEKFKYYLKLEKVIK
jgi:hypothetical protein